MRVSALAKKIELNPSSIIDFCETNGIDTSNGANSKLSNEEVQQIIEGLAPEKLTLVFPEEDQEPEEIISEIEEEEKVEKDIESNPVPEEPVVHPEEEDKNEEPEPDKENEEEEVEVIRAPKVTLQGLKVWWPVDYLVQFGCVNR